MLSVASWVLTGGLLDAGWSRPDGTLTVEPGVALVAVVLAFAWAFVLGLCVLLVLELLVPTGSVRGRGARSEGCARAVARRGATPRSWGSASGTASVGRSRAERGSRTARACRAPTSGDRRPRCATP